MRNEKLKVLKTAFSGSIPQVQWPLKRSGVLSLCPVQIPIVVTLVRLRLIQSTFLTVGFAIEKPRVRSYPV